MYIPYLKHYKQYRNKTYYRITTNFTAEVSKRPLQQFNGAIATIQ